MNPADNNKPTTSTTSPAQRRGFVRAAAGAALLSTVVSRPVWASHCSISGNLSGNLSGQHGDEPCTLATYSPGAWTQGSAFRNGLWEHLSPYTLSSTCGNLLGVDQLLTESETDNGLKASSTLSAALGGGNHGWERQCCAAALNAVLWQNRLAACEISPADCSDSGGVDSTFYFPFTLADIQAIYLNGPGGGYPEIWETAQTID